MLDANAVTAIIKDRANSLSSLLNERSSSISVITEAELLFGLARRAVNADLRRIVENFFGECGYSAMDFRLCATLRLIAHRLRSVR